MGYTVILPTLNENGHISKLVNEICKLFINNKIEYEILIIDDNSTDGTIDIIKKKFATNSNVKLFVRHGQKKNLAKSINLGIKKSKFQKIIWMDADFQHPPEYIQNIINISNKFDVIVFSRFLKESERYFNNDTAQKEINEDQSIFFNKICNLLFYKDLTDYTSGYICINKSIFDSYKLKGYYGDYFLSLLIFCKKNNFSIIELPFKERIRESGHSKTGSNINIKYIYLCANYFFTFFKNIIIKNFN
jgi:dolichol-phosphate mannosyltransferase